jgi:hypothetical protein
MTMPPTEAAYSRRGGNRVHPKWRRQKFTIGIWTAKTPILKGIGHIKTQPKIVAAHTFKRTARVSMADKRPHLQKNILRTENKTCTFSP